MKRAFETRFGNSAAIAALCVRAMVTLVLSLYVAQWERQALQAEVRRLAEDKETAFEATMLKATEVLFSLRSLYLSTGEMRYQHFELFARHAIGRDPSLQAIQWLPRVAASERKDYESRLQATGLSDFGQSGRDLSSANAGKGTALVFRVRRNPS